MDSDSVTLRSTETSAHDCRVAHAHLNRQDVPAFSQDHHTIARLSHREWLERGQFSSGLEACNLLQVLKINDRHD